MTIIAELLIVYIFATQAFNYLVKEKSKSLGKFEKHLSNLENTTLVEIDKKKEETKNFAYGNEMVLGNIKESLLVLVNMCDNLEMLTMESRDDSLPNDNFNYLLDDIYNTRMSYAAAFTSVFRMTPEEYHHRKIATKGKFCDMYLN